MNILHELKCQYTFDLNHLMERGKKLNQQWDSNDGHCWKPTVLITLPSSLFHDGEKISLINPQSNFTQTVYR